MKTIRKPLKHRILISLDPAPFEDLCAADLQGGTEFYSFDVFRRLYNDAVESMLYYRKLAQANRSEADALHVRCQKLECALMELTDRCDNNNV